MIGVPALAYLNSISAFGVNQWAYQKKKSSKDLLTLLLCLWLKVCFQGKCIAAFLSDIAGAFDRVSADLLLFKLRSYDLNVIYFKFFESLLVPRRGNVCVQSQKSSDLILEDTIFQDMMITRKPSQMI